MPQRQRVLHHLSTSLAGSISNSDGDELHQREQAPKRSRAGSLSRSELDLRRGEPATRPMQYKYQAIDERDEIRILSLRPGSFGNPLRGTFINSRLSACTRSGEYHPPASSCLHKSGPGSILISESADSPHAEGIEDDDNRSADDLQDGHSRLSDGVGTANKAAGGAPTAKLHSDPRYTNDRGLEDPEQEGHVEADLVEEGESDSEDSNQGTLEREWHPDHSVEWPAQHALQSPPQYEAISYAWGAAIKPRTICIDGASVPITVSLHEALQHLR